MKKGIALTILVSIALVVFSIASCGSKSEERSTQKSAQPKQIAKSPYEETYKTETAKPSFKPFPVYSDRRSPDNHYIPSGWMGDYGDIKMDEASFENPHSGTTCIKFTYTAQASQGARWAGVYWQNPANNWGDRKGGFDLTGATKLTFWVRGEKGDERIEEFKIGGISGQYSDSDVAGIGPVMLTKEWKQYEIDLTGKDLSYISGGFCWATNMDVNPEGCTFYLDDIRYE